MNAMINVKSVMDRGRRRKYRRKYDYVPPSQKKILCAGVVDTLSLSRTDRQTICTPEAQLIITTTFDRRRAVRHIMILLLIPDEPNTLELSNTLLCHKA
jgi:hypothetical protein